MSEQIVAKVRLHNYRYPKDKVHTSGQFAIVIFDVLELTSGEISPEARNANGGIVVTGNMPRIEDGMDYILKATRIVDKTWGIQYSCDEINMAYDMANAEEQKKFFSFFVSDKMIDSLFSTYDNPVELLEQRNIEALTKVKGIGKIVATKLCDKYNDNKNNSRAYVELKELGLTKNAIDGLITRFGSVDVTIDIIKSNPYQLITLVRGYGWERADRIALKMGFGKGCQQRCLAYGRYKLEKFAVEEGNSNMNIDEFIDDITVVCFPTEKQQIAAWIKEQTMGQEEFEKYIVDEPKGEKPMFFYSKDERKIGLFHLRVTERKVCNELCRLKCAPPMKKFDKAYCIRIIQEVEEEQGYTYTKEQLKAIWSILDNNVCVLTGRAGCGKTTTLKPVVRIFEHYGYKVAQCALSGRAASLLTEYTGIEGKTIHRLLQYLPEKESFGHNKGNPLSADAIILDETSMVGEELFLDLIESIKSGAKLIMLGDIKQLPPISVGNILNDCIQSGYITTSVLTIIQRQAALSGIVEEASKVCDGKSLVKNDFSGESIRGVLKDFKLVSTHDAAVVHAKVISEFKRLVFDEKIPLDDVQVIVPVRVKGENSCFHFNTEIQRLVNNDAKKSVSVEFTDNGQQIKVTFKTGDRIIITKNNYHARGISGKEVAIFNGNMGHIVDLDQDNIILDLNDGEENVILPKEHWNDINLAYACTAHKLQGSQAKYVIIGLDSSSHPLLIREWLYTAITRARKYCALVGQPRAINLATRVSDIKLKRTWLKNDLVNLHKKEDFVL